MKNANETLILPKSGSGKELVVASVWRACRRWAGNARRCAVALERVLTVLAGGMAVVAGAITRLGCAGGVWEDRLFRRTAATLVATIALLPVVAEAQEPEPPLPEISVRAEHGTVVGDGVNRVTFVLEWEGTIPGEDRLRAAEFLLGGYQGVVNVDSLDGLEPSSGYVEAEISVESPQRYSFPTIALAHGATAETVTFLLYSSDDTNRVVAGMDTAEVRVVAPTAGDVVVTGDVEAGETLMADTSMIMDPVGGATYQWQRSSNRDFSSLTNIGTGSASYVVRSVDEDEFIRVLVRFTNADGLVETKTSAAVRSNIPHTGGGVDYAGGDDFDENAEVWYAYAGVTLTASLRMADDYVDELVDENGLPYPLVFDWQWKRVGPSTGNVPIDIGVPVMGMATSTYRLVLEDIGHRVYAEPTYVDMDGYRETLDVDEFYVSARQPPDRPAVWSVVIVLTGPGSEGTADVDEAVTALVTGTVTDENGVPDEGDSDSTPTEGTAAILSIKWQREDEPGRWTDIEDTSGSIITGPSYVLAAADIGLVVRPAVYFTDGAGRPEEYADVSTGVVNSPATGDVDIMGTMVDGETLTADTNEIGDLNGPTDPVFSYQWQRADDSTGVGEVNIDGETDPTFTLTSDDATKYIRVVVTFVDDDNHNETRVSSWVGPVLPPAVSIANAGAVNEGGDLVFNVMISPPVDAEFDITYTLSGTNVTAADFIDSDLADTNGNPVLTGTLTIPANTTTASITLTTATADGQEEEEEAVTLTFTYVGQQADDQNEATGTVRDREVPVITVDNATAIREGLDLIFDVSVRPRSNRPLTLTYTLSGTGVTAADFQSPVLTGTLTILPDEILPAILLPTRIDNVAEADEEVRLTYSGDASGVATGTIIDSGTRLVEISKGSRGPISEGENLVFDLLLDKPTTAQLDIAYEISGTGITEADFVDDSDLTFPRGTVRVPANVESFTIDHTTAVDGAVEGPEMVTVTLVDGPGYFLRPGSATRFASNTINDVAVPATPTVAISDAQSITEGDTLVFKVDVVPASTVDLQVGYTLSGSIEPADFDDSDLTDTSGTLTGTLTIPAYSQSASINLTTVDSDGDPGDESVTVTLSTGTGYDLAAAPANEASGTIINYVHPPASDQIAQIPFAGFIPRSIDEGSSARYEFEITDDHTDYTVRLFASGTATPQADYRVAVGSGSSKRYLLYNTGGGFYDYTFSASTVNQYVTIDFEVVQDAVVEPGANETIMIDLYHLEGGIFTSARLPDSIEIRDQNQRLVASLRDDGSVRTKLEGEDLEFTVQLNTATGDSHRTTTSSVEITVPYTIVPGEGNPQSVDFDPPSLTGEVVIPAGQTEATVSITAVADAFSDSGERFRINLDPAPSPSQAVEIGRPSFLQARILDSRQRVAVTRARALEGEDLVFTVTMDPTSHQAVTLEYDIVAGTATESTDYTLPSAPHTIEIPADTGRAMITVPTVMDTDTAESDETLTLNVHCDTSSCTADRRLLDVSIASASGTIVNRSDVPTITITAANNRAVESSDPQHPGLDQELVFVVEISPDPSQEIRVPFFLRGMADLMDDYTITSDATVTNPLILTAQHPSRRIVLTVVNDSLPEMNETVEVMLGEPIGTDGVPLASSVASLALPNSATGIILANDTPSLEFALSGSVITENGGTADITVRVADSVQFAEDQTVTLQFGGTATPGTDFMLTDPASYEITLPANTANAEATTRITATDDPLDEGASETVEISAVFDATGAVIGSTLSLTITDDDTASLAIGVSSATVSSASSVTISETDDSTTRSADETVATVTVSIGNTIAFERDQTISLSVGSGTEAALGADFMFSEAGAGPVYTLTLPAGDTAASVSATITARQDQIYEPGGEDIVFEAAHVQRGGAQIGSATVTIEDDDTPTLAVVLAGTAEAVGEESGSTTVSLAITNGKRFATAQMFNLVFSGTATLGTDYTVSGIDTVQGSTHIYRLVLPAGYPSAGATITLNDDTHDEGGGETIAVAATHVGGSIVVADDTLTITDNDTVSVRFTAVPTTISEHGNRRLEGGRTQLTVSVVGTGMFEGVKYFKLEFSGTATIGVDYRVDDSFGLVRVGEDTAVYQLGIPARGTGNSLTIGALQDSIDEGSTETIMVRMVPLTGPIAREDGTAITGDTEGTEQTAAAVTRTVRIADDDDTIVTVAADTTIDSDSATDGVSVNEGSPANFTLTRAGYTESALTVNLTITVTSGDGTTQESPETVTFLAGQSEASFGVEIDADGVDTDNYVITLALGDTEGVAAGDPASADITVVDTDAPPTVTVRAPSSAVAEGEVLIFTVSLSALSGKVITVEYDISGDADETDDYTVDSTTPSPLTFVPGDDDEFVNIFTRQDNRDEGDQETVIITLGDMVNATPGAEAMRSATGLISDIDATPVLSIAAPTDPVDEGDDLVFTVTVTPPSNRQIIVPYSVAGSGENMATAVDDFMDRSITAGTLTIPAGDATASITLGTVDDQPDEPDETLTVTLLDSRGGVNLTNATLSSTATAEGTIADVDVPMFTIDDAAAVEGQDITFTVERDIVSWQTFRVTWTLTDDTAVASADYQDSPTTGTLTFAPTDSRMTFSVSTINNDDTDGSKEFTVTLSLEASVTEEDATLQDPPTAKGRVIDDEQPLISAAVSGKVTGSSVEEGEDAIFTLTRSGDIRPALTIPYTITQTMGKVIRVSSPISGTARFQEAQLTAEVSIATHNDNFDEIDGILTLTLDTPPQGAVYGLDTVTSAAITVTDNEATPTVSISGVRSSVTEGQLTSSGFATDLEFSVSISHPSDLPIRVPYTVTGSTPSPASPEDFAARPQSPLMFGSNGATQQTLFVAVVDDDLDEPQETLTVTLVESVTLADSTTVALTNATINPAASEESGTITDNDLPLVTVAAHSAITDSTVSEGGEVRFTLTRAGVLTDPLPVTFRVDDTGSALVDPAPTTAMFVAGSATVDLPAMATTNDMVENVDALVTLTVEAGVTYRAGAPGGSATITVADDDEFTVAISGPVAAVAEGEDMEFTVTLEGPPTSGRAITVPYRFNAAGTDTATIGQDYTFGAPGSVIVPAGSVVFPVGSVNGATQTITLASVDDDINEPQETVSVTLGDPTPADAAALPVVVADRTASGMIDDVDLPQLSIAVSSAIAGSLEGSPVEFTVTVDPASYQELMVVYALAGDTQGDNTATEGTDYTNPGDHAARTLTIAPQQSTITFTVHTVADFVSELNETFTVSLAAITPADGGAVAAGAAGMATATIIDSNLPVVTVAVHENVQDNAVMEAAPASFTLTRLGNLTDPLTVDYTVLAAEGVLAASQPTSAMFLAGEETVDVDLATEDDTVEEANADVTITVLAGSLNRIDAPNANATLTVIDDDVFTLAVAAPAAAVLEGSAMEFTVTLGGDVTAGRDITVPYTINSAFTDTADSDDYEDTTASPGSLVFAVGATTGATATITLDLVEDSVNETQETVSVTLGAPTPADAAALPVVVADRTASGLINDGDVPVVSIANSYATEGSPITFTVSVTPPSLESVSVAYDLAEGTAAQGVDYENPTVSSRRVTIPARSEAATFTIDTIQDELQEDNETFTVTLRNLSTASDAALATDGSHTATGFINDDDRPAITIADASAAEGSAITFTVSVTSAVATDLDIQYSLVDDTATGGADFVSPAAQSLRSITIEAGFSFQRFVVDTVQDDDDEADETFIVRLDSVAPPAIANIRYGEEGMATGTITDDDSPMLSVADATATEGSAVSFRVSIEPASFQPLMLVYSLFGDTATEGDDYISPATPSARTVEIPAGSSTFDLTVDTVRDEINEADETFQITLDSVAPADGGAAIVTDGGETATGTITDDDGSVLSIADNASATEGDPVTFTVNIAPASNQPLAVVYSLTDETATGGADYASPASDDDRMIMIPAGRTSHDITIPTIQDGEDEPDETFRVTLVSVAPSDGGAAIADGIGESAIGTIVDDDVTELTVANAFAIEGETMTFTVTATPPSYRDLWFVYSRTDGTAVEGEDFRGPVEQINRRVRIAAGDATGTFDIVTLDDEIKESNETFTVSIDEVSPASIATIAAPGSGGSATGTINDDDTPLITMGADQTVEEGGTMTFTVSVAPTLTADLDIAYSLTGDTEAGNTATADEDFTNPVSAVRSVLIPAGMSSATFAVATLDDDADEPAETFTVSLTGSTPADGVNIAAGPAGMSTGTITDDDVPVLSFESDAFAEEGQRITFTVISTPANHQDLMVTYSLTGDSQTGNTATEGTDYINPVDAADGTFTIPAGTGSGAFTVETVLDMADEDDETFTVTLVSVTPSDGADIAASPGSMATGTITGKDLPQLSIADDSSAEEGEVLEFTVTLSQASSVEITVDYVLAGTATINEDYTDRTVRTGNSQTLTFERNELEQTIRLATVQDNLDEPARETVIVSLANLQPAGQAALRADAATATGVITDVDVPEFRMQLSSSRTSTGEQVFDFEVTLDPPSTLEISIEYELGGDASIGEDYTCAIVEFDEEGDESADTDSNCPVDSSAEESGERDSASARSEAMAESDQMKAALESAVAELGGAHPAQAGLSGTLVYGPRESRKSIRMTVQPIEDKPEQPESIVVTLGEITPSGVASVAQGQGSRSAMLGFSILEKPRLDGAITLLHHHVSRFESVISNAALSRFRGGRSVRLRAGGVDGVDSVDASARSTFGLYDTRWSGWGSLTYGSVGGRGDGSSYDFYAGTDFLTSSGNGVLGLLVGYEVGDLEIEEAEYSASNLQLGLYGATRARSGLTMDGAIAIGSASPSVSEGDVTGEFSSQRLTVKAAVGWRGDQTAFEPTIGLLYVTESLDGFTDSAGGVVEEESLGIARLSAGVKLVASFEAGEFILQPQLNYNSENLGDTSESSVSSSIRASLRYLLQSGSILQFTGSANGLGSSDTYTSFTLGGDFTIPF